MNVQKAEEILSSLKDFQRRTVNHVIDRLYLAPDSTHRFLVADEVGTGKTLVAKGVIACAVEHLEKVDSVNRIDIVYICSNAAIARQNVRKLDVFGTGSRHANTRITMLASQIQDLNRITPGRKTVNLVAFTPGTSFEKGHQGGKVQERALLYAMLEKLFPDRERYLARLLRLNRGRDSWEYWKSRYTENEKFDKDIQSRFIAEVKHRPLWNHINEMVNVCSGRGEIPKSELIRARKIVGLLRSALARASIDALEPDLIILDEFQRFKHLLETPSEDSDVDDIRRLSQQLFSYEDVRVLLLSATPYKLFTMPGEELVAGDDHYKDFLATTRFLVGGNSEKAIEIETAFKEFRKALLVRSNAESKKLVAQNLLVKVMSRTERPTVGESKMGSERTSQLGTPSASELLSYVAMEQMARSVDESIPVEYWKSVPYFLNFMSGYKVGERLEEHMKHDLKSKISRQAMAIQPSQIRRRAEIDPGNARMRGLQAQVFENGLWKLLWLPPSLPYIAPGGAYASIDHASITKRLIFSSWSASPSSISALLSHEVSRRIFGANGEDKIVFDPSPRLVYKKGDTHAKGMSALALFTPVRALADITDVLEIICKSHGEILEPDFAVSEIQKVVASGIPVSSQKSLRPNRESWYWSVPFSMVANKEDLWQLASLETDEEEHQDESGARSQGIETAVGVSINGLGRAPEDIDFWVAMIGMFGPGNVAYRAIRRWSKSSTLSEPTVLRAAAIVGEGFRSLFNRPEAMALIDYLITEPGEDYWQRVLRYCKDGDLQAVMDEYFHHLFENFGAENDDALLDIATQVRNSLALKTSAVNLFDPHKPEKNFHINTRFAVRYGSTKGNVKSDEKLENRMTAVQHAFNSPFWPMVLASTSVGQEGVDFHWWCHSLVHWNLPSNPVDLEQREGRIHRFKGHAIRKNVAAAFRGDAFRSDVIDPWIALFDAAHRDRSVEVAEKIGDLWPWWVFPGEATIETWTPCLPFSKDLEREKRLRRLRDVYRLAFGQPRQEDFLGLINNGDEAVTPLDLRPPS